MSGRRGIPPHGLIRRATARRTLEIMAASPDVTDRLLTWAHVHFSPAHRPPDWGGSPSPPSLSVVLSLAADAALVFVGTRLFPSTKGYVHFSFATTAN